MEPPPSAASHLEQQDLIDDDKELLRTFSEWLRAENTAFTQVGTGVKYCTDTSLQGRLRTLCQNLKSIDSVSVSKLQAYN